MSKKHGSHDDPAERDYNQQPQLFLVGQGTPEASEDTQSITTSSPRSAKSVLRVLHSPKPRESDRAIPFEDIGLGNLWKKRIYGLQDELMDDVLTLEEYDPLQKLDRPIFELQQAVIIVNTALGENDASTSDYLLKKAEAAAGTKSIQEVQLAGMRDYDSLSILKNVFQFIPSDNDDLKEQIMDISPSLMWRNEKLKELVLHMINLCYTLLVEYDSLPHRYSQNRLRPYADQFIRDLQEKCLKEVIKHPRPLARGPAQTSFERRLSDLSRKAWAGWNNGTSPYEPPADRFHSA